MITVKVRVKPGASQDQLVGWEGETLRIRLRARAIEGKANRSLVELLASALGLRPWQVELLRGEQSREKLVGLDLPSTEELHRRLHLRDRA